jgi:hypothetical protein
VIPDVRCLPLVELGYRAAGGALPDDWYQMARLLVASRVVGILDEERELPVVFTECRELIAALIEELAP